MARHIPRISVTSDGRVVSDTTDGRPTGTLPVAASIPPNSNNTSSGAPHIPGHAHVSTRGHNASEPSPQPQFFVDHRKGEIAELKTLLRSLRAERNQTKQRDVIKKVIAYMTLGIDVSPLFSEMVMASSTDDLVQKKMVYLYLTTYAESNVDLAVLTINTLLKDCQDNDPTVRGLALRSLCSLKIAQISEYMEKAIRAGLRDSNPYVRKASCLGILKLNATNAADEKLTKDSDLVQALFNFILEDPDPTVVTNSVYAVNEILAADGGLNLTRPLIAKLLNRLRSFGEWGQCQVLSLLTTFVKSLNPDDATIFDIMNLVEERFTKSSASVVMGCTKCFIEISLKKPELAEQIYERLKHPCLTLLATSSVDVAYVILTHLKLIVTASSAGASAFTSEYQHFFCRYSDPSYSKECKVEILAILASPENVAHIQAELADYASDVDVAIAKKSITALGRIALGVRTASEAVLSQLLSFLNFEIGYISTATLTTLRNILRNYSEYFPSVSSLIASDFAKIFSTCADPEGICALLWIIGETENEVTDAPYLLESAIDSVFPPLLTTTTLKTKMADGCSLDHTAVLTTSCQSEGEGVLQSATMSASGTAVRLTMISSAAKLFLQRPAVMLPILGDILRRAITADYSPDVRDRALFVYRLLKSDPEAAKDIVLTEKTPLTDFETAAESKRAIQLLDHFNSLSVVYGRQPSTYLTVPDIPFGGSAPSLGLNASTTLTAASGVVDDSRNNIRKLLSSMSGADSQLTDDEKKQRAGGSYTSALSRSRNSTADMLDFGESRRTDTPSEKNVEGLHTDVLGGILDDENRKSEDPPTTTTSTATRVHKPRNDKRFFELASCVTMSAPKFAATWSAVEASVDHTMSAEGLRGQCGGTLTLQNVENVFERHRLQCVASGAVNNGLKCFFCAEAASSDNNERSTFLLEVIVDTDSNDPEAEKVHLKMKSHESPEALQRFALYVFENCLGAETLVLTDLAY